MDCKKACRLLQDMIDGSLSKAETRRVKAHVDGCHQCADELSSLRHLVASLDRLPLAPAPPRLTDRVLDRLREAGRIVDETVAADAAVGRMFGWIRAPFRIPVAAAVLLLLAIAVFPATIGPLEGIVGKGTVFVTGAYLQVQDRVAGVEVVSRLIDNLEKNLRTLKTIALAAVSLLGEAGAVLMVPALVMLLFLTLAVLLYVRSSHKRSAQHAAMFSF